jgi:S-adenosylmethionine decarboxylase
MIEGLSKVLGMTIIYGPIVKNLAGSLNPKHAGLEAVAIWAESGLSVYVWNEPALFTTDIYTCKPFEPQKALDYISTFFVPEKLSFKEV